MDVWGKGEGVCCSGSERLHASALSNVSLHCFIRLLFHICFAIIVYLCLPRLKHFCKCHLQQLVKYLI